MNIFDKNAEETSAEQNNRWSTETQAAFQGITSQMNSPHKVDGVQQFKLWIAEIGLHTKGLHKSTQLAQQLKGLGELADHIVSGSAPSAEDWSLVREIDIRKVQSALKTLNAIKGLKTAEHSEGGDASPGETLNFEQEILSDMGLTQPLLGAIQSAKNDAAKMSFPGHSGPARGAA